MNSIIRDFGLEIILIEAVLFLATLMILVIQTLNRREMKKSGKGSSKHISKDKYNSVVSECRQWQTTCNSLKKQVESKQRDYLTLRSEYNRIKEQFGDCVIKNSQLKEEIEKLKKEQGGQLQEEKKEQSSSKAPQKFTFEKDSSESNNVASENSDEKKEEEKNLNNSPKTTDHSIQEDTQEKNEIKRDSSEGMIMYASFPRSAGSQRYFSDLHENRADDSFFEFIINEIQGKATFKPLDFMKIRSIDESMIAIETEGAKPNVASSVIGIEPGSAHLEGKDWIIDKQAKLKLA